MQKGLWLSRAQGAWPVRRVQRVDAANAGLPAFHARAVEGVDAPSAAAGGGPAGRRPRLLLLRAPGNAVLPRNSWVIPHPSEADRGLSAAPQISAKVPQGAQGHWPANATQQIRSSA